MPNWVANVIEMPGIAKLDLYYENELGCLEFDFSKLIQMPESIFQTMNKPLHLTQFEEDNWYDWSWQNWGTKWNACSTQIVSDDIIRFETAYKPPCRVIYRLSKLNPDKLIHVYYCDEIGNTGSFICRNGLDYNIKLASSKAIRDICWHGQYDKMSRHHVDKFKEYTVITEYKEN